jgi:hypothetical protein
MNAEWRFNVVLDQISGSDPKLTDSILETPARSPSCLREIFEQTLIEPAGEHRSQISISFLSITRRFTIPPAIGKMARYRGAVVSNVIRRLMSTWVWRSGACTARGVRTLFHFVLHLERTVTIAIANRVIHKERVGAQENRKRAKQSRAGTRSRAGWNNLDKRRPASTAQ